MIPSNATSSPALRALSSGSMVVLATTGQGYGRPLGAGGRRGRHGLGNQGGLDLHYLFVSSIVRALRSSTATMALAGMDGNRTHPGRLIPCILSLPTSLQKSPCA